MGLAPTLVRGEQHTTHVACAGRTHVTPTRHAGQAQTDYTADPGRPNCCFVGEGVHRASEGGALQTASVPDSQNTTSAEAITLTLAVHS